MNSKFDLEILKINEVENLHLIKLKKTEGAYNEFQDFTRKLISSLNLLAH